MRIRWAVLGVVVAAVLSATATSVASADTISATCTSNGATGPCNSEWYRGPVTVTWQTDTPPQSVSPCELGLATEYTADSVMPLSCTANWSDGTLASFGFSLHVEASAPTATATAARAPDANGWYNHPVAISFSGSGFSGPASCSPSSTTYAGPEAADAVLASTCTDPAGKTATASLSLNYDATPPTITGATASRKPGADGYYSSPVDFTFEGTDPISGIASCQTVTYSGPSSGSVVGGCWDRAGNYATISVPVKYRAATPLASVARAGSSLRLHWKRAAHASYYNVQIYRGGKKILSTWPSKTSLLVRRAWSYARHHYKLKAGRYRWYVWPGYGSRKAAHYGRRIVSSTFTVSKPV